MSVPATTEVATTPATGLVAQVDDEGLPPRPYPGLRAFEPSEWAFYFGREAATEEVISLLRRQGLVLVHGASGCGKSSLVRAGVLPSLAIDHEADGEGWRTAVMRPSEGPLQKLADILDAAFPVPPRDISWDDRVLDAPGLVAEITARLAAEGGSFCLVIDQFEEIFRWAREHGSGEPRLLIDILLAIGDPKNRPSGLFVILTMRSDYLGHCAQFAGFAEHLNTRLYLLPKMDSLGLLRAIHEPAELYGGRVDEAVASQILPVVTDELDGLPVLQHALMRAAEAARARTGGADGWTVTCEDLADVGGAANALALHAEDVLARATRGREDLEDAARWIFRALTDLDADRRAIRRPCSVEELIAVSGVSRAETLALLDAFRAPDCNFLSPYAPEPLSDDRQVEISHEALIRQWPRISARGLDKETGQPEGWLYQEFQDGMVWRALAVQAQAFAEDRRRVLSAATTEQRWRWFRRIEQRPQWIRRHLVRDDIDKTRAFALEWEAVSALMKASRKNLERERNIVFRLRRVRNLGAVLFGVFVIGAGLGGWILFDKVLELRERRGQLIAQQKQLKGQLQSSAAYAVGLQQVADRLIAMSCDDFKGDPAQFALCKASLTRQYNMSTAMPAVTAPLTSARGCATAEECEINR